MLKSIDIVGFQSHKNSRFVFHPGVNAVLGISDSGKSSLDRAIRKVEQNRPSSARFINRDCSSCRLALTVEEGDTIVRNVGKNDNYVINDEEPLTALNQGVPEDVSNILNMGPLNHSVQSSPHFLLSSTPGQIAKMINEVADLTVIDSSIKWIQNAGKKNSERQKYAEQDCAKAKSALESLEFLDDMVSDLEALESKDLAITGLRESINGMDRITRHLDSIDLSMAESAYVERMDASLSSLESMDRDRTALRRSVKALAIHLDSMDEAEEAISNWDSLEDIGSRLVALESKNKAMKSMSPESEKLESLISRIELMEAGIVSLDSEIVDAELRLKKLMPEKCPLCGKPK